MGNLMTRRTVHALVLAGGLALASPATAQQTLTAQDRADIQALTAGYASALGACEAEAYANLFAPETGYFASNIRGEVIGRDKLIALVRSERHCTTPAPAGRGGAAGQARPAPMVAITVTPAGVTGRADLGTARYDDEYVKTPAGWRFMSRTVMTQPEIEAGLTAEDTRAIRRLAGSDLGIFEDVYVTGENGARRFRTAGVELGLSADGVTGRAALRNDDGHYEDVYVRASGGGWRFRSRTYVAN
jgi:hypothetical protein